MTGTVKYPDQATCGIILSLSRPQESEVWSNPTRYRDREGSHVHSKWGAIAATRRERGCEARAWFVREVDQATGTPKYKERRPA